MNNIVEQLTQQQYIRNKLKSLHMSVLQVLQQIIESQENNKLQYIINSKLDIQTKSVLLSNILKNASDSQKDNILQWFNNEGNTIKDFGQKFYDALCKINDFNTQPLVNYVSKQIGVNQQKNSDIKPEELKYPTQDTLSSILAMLQTPYHDKALNNTLNFDLKLANIQDNSLQQKILSINHSQINIQQLINDIDINKIKSLDFVAKQILLQYISTVQLNKSILEAQIDNINQLDNKRKQNQLIQDKLLKIAEQLEIRAMIWIYQYSTNQLKELIVKQIFETICKHPRTLDALRDYELLRFLIEYYAEYMQTNDTIPTIKDLETDEDSTNISFEEQGKNQVIFFTNFYINYLAEILDVQILTKPIQDIPSDSHQSLLHYLNKRMLGFSLSKTYKKNFNVRQLKYIEICFLMYYITIYKHKTKLTEQQGIEQFINYLSVIQNNIYIVQSSQPVKVSIYKLDQLNTCLCTQTGTDINKNSIGIEYYMENQILNQQNNQNADSFTQRNELMSKQNIDQLFDKWVLDESQCWKQYTVTAGPIFIDSTDNYVVIFEADNKKIRFNRLQHHLINSSVLNLQNGPNTQIKLSIFNGLDQIIELNDSDYEIVNANNLNVTQWIDSTNRTYKFLQPNKTHKLFIKYKHSLDCFKNLNNQLIQTFASIFKQNTDRERYIQMPQSEYRYEYITISPTIPMISSTLLVVPNIQQLTSQDSRNVSFYIALIAQSNEMSGYQAIQIPHLPQNVITLSQITTQNITSQVNVTLEEISDDDKQIFVQFDKSDEQKWYKFTGQIQSDAIQVQIGCTYTVYGSVYSVPKVCIDLVNQTQAFTINSLYQGQQLNIQVLQVATMKPASNIDVNVQIGNQKQSLNTDSNGHIYINNIELDNIGKIKIIIENQNYILPVQQRLKVISQMSQMKYINLNNTQQICLQEWITAEQQYVGKIQNISNEGHVTMMFQPIFYDHVHVTSFMNILQFKMAEQKIFGFKVKCNGITPPLWLSNQNRAQHIICSTLNMSQMSISQAIDNIYKHSTGMIFENSDDSSNDKQIKCLEDENSTFYHWGGRNIYYTLQTCQQNTAKIFNPNYSQLKNIFTDFQPQDKVKFYEFTNSGMIYEGYDGIC